MQHIVLKSRALAASATLIGLASLSLVGCDDEEPSPEEVCGPCGTIATGQLSISGNAQLDGFFTAVAYLQEASTSLRSTVENELRILGNIYGFNGRVIDEEFVADLIAAIRTDINSSVSVASFRLEYRPPRCAANVDIAAAAQATCEANAGCEVEVDPGGMEAVECNGTCTGSCSGGCSGSIACNPPAGSTACDLSCEGVCILEIGDTCEGICRGQCSGPCSATVFNAEGDLECAGECDAMCEGICELSISAQCPGTCYGTCYASTPPSDCEFEPITCNGGCMGMCEGGCAGRFTPPSSSVDCEASLACHAQASAQAEANFHCSPPSLDFVFELDTSTDLEARAQFLARLDLLRLHLANALQAAAHAEALIDGVINGEFVLDPPPLANLTASLQDFVDNSADRFEALDIPPGRISCLIPAFTEAVSSLDDIKDDLQVATSYSFGLLVFIEDPTG